MNLAAETLLSLLEAHPYLLLFPLAMAEGPVATVSAGFLVSAGLAGWAPALGVVVAADLAGDTLFYLLGRSGRRPWAGRLLARLGVDEGRMASLEGAFERHGAKVLAGAKVADFAAIPTLAAAGFARMGFGRFFGWSVAFTVPKSATLLALGFFFGESALHFIRHMDGSYVPILIALAAGVGVFAVAGRSAHKEKSDRETEERA